MTAISGPLSCARSAGIARSMVTAISSGPAWSAACCTRMTSIATTIPARCGPSSEASRARAAPGGTGMSSSSAGGRSSAGSAVALAGSVPVAGSAVVVLIGRSSLPGWVRVRPGRFRPT